MANRAERRRIAKSDADLLRKGIDSSRPPDRQKVAALIRRAHDAVLNAIKSKMVDEIAALSQSQADMAANFVRDVPIACGRGCSYCCNIWVAASPHEVFHFAKTYPKAGLSDFKERLSVAHESYGSASFDQRGEMVTPCPALVDDQCSNYANRPLVCRTASSPDSNLCRRAYLEMSGENIQVPMVDIIRKSTISASMHAAIRHAGLHDHSVEFAAGVKLALEDPTAEARWLSGDDVFSAIPHDPVAPGEDRSTRELGRWAIEDLGQP